MPVFYDAEAILADADVETVASFVGIEMSRSGSVVRIKCPGHLKRLGREDGSFGSCVLTDNGYYCYACRCGQNLIGMVQEASDCSYQEALAIIGDANGGKEHYIVSGKANVPYKQPIKVLSNEDLKLIGLESNVYYDTILFIDSDKSYIRNCNLVAKPDPVNMDAKYLAATKNQSISIKNLKLNNEKLYNTIVKNAAKKSINRYQDAIDNICSRDGSKSDLLKKYYNVSVLSDEMIYDFKTKFTKMYERCLEIYNEIDEANCISDLLLKEEIKTSIPKYDLFD